MQFKFVPIRNLEETFMINFTPDFLENFLGIVRKYMQLRGGLSQKDLSEQTNVGISTMSRFLNLKTNTVDEQLIANIVATLNIPLHEIIDGIDEASTDTFKRLVQFYKDQKLTDKKQAPPASAENDDISAGLLSGRDRDTGPGLRAKTSATINLGARKQASSFDEEASQQATKTTDISLKDKLQTLSPRQKAYLTDFLDLEVGDRDLIVDLGDAVFRYFRQRSVEF